MAKEKNTVLFDDPASLGFGDVIMESREDPFLLSRKQQRQFFTQSKNKLMTKVKKQKIPKITSCDYNETLSPVSISYSSTGNHSGKTHRSKIMNDPDKVERNIDLSQEMAVMISDTNTISDSYTMNNTLLGHESFTPSMDSKYTHLNGHANDLTDDWFFFSPSSSSTTMESDHSFMVQSTEAGHENKDRKEEEEEEELDWPHRFLKALVKRTDYYFADLPPLAPVAAVCCLVTACVSL